MRSLARVRQFCWLLSFATVGVTSLSAQTGVTKAPVEAPLAYGTVTGHVSLLGSNAPARLVNVGLQSLQVQAEPTRFTGRATPLPVTIYQTDLDGSYTIPHVAPGTYYVVVSAPGFLSPFTEFTSDELRNPSREIAARIAATLPVISVQPNSTTVHDVRLERGASLSGTVRFDDGTPFFGAALFLQRKGTDGKWVSTHSYSNRPTVDTEGHWEQTGLLAGEYRIQVKMELNDRKQSSGFSNNTSSSSYTRYELNFYLGDTARSQAAKTVKLEENERAPGQDITIPLSKLHGVFGAVVDAGTGQALNAGTVRLQDAASGESVADTPIDSKTRTFSFPFVPEGEYKLHVDNPREARFEPATDGTADPNFPERDRKETVVRQYAPGDIPLIVQGEMSGVSLAVEARAAKP